MNRPTHFREAGTWSPCGVRLTAFVPWAWEEDEVTCPTCRLQAEAVAADQNPKAGIS